MRSKALLASLIGLASTFGDRAVDMMPRMSNRWANNRFGFKWASPSKYMPHQNYRECSRRQRQMGVRGTKRIDQ